MYITEHRPALLGRFVTVAPSINIQTYLLSTYYIKFESVIVSVAVSMFGCT